MLNRLFHIVFFCALAVPAPVQAQPFEAIDRAFTQYARQHYIEKLFVHTDKSVYATGEVLWFKLYVVDGFTHRPSALSRMAYVELLDAGQKPALQAKIELDSGSGQGSFLLPATLKTGNYLLRAYTAWMKNADASYFYETTLSVINPAKKPEPAAADTAGALLLQVFPEGGRLVGGLPGAAAIELTDRYGNGRAAELQLKTEAGVVLQSFTTNSAGLAKIAFTPAANQRYRIETKGATPVSKGLEIADRGSTLQVQRGPGHFKASVYASAGTGSAVYLLVQARHSIRLARQLALQNGQAQTEIPDDLLQEGVNHITVFNQQRQPVCERLVYKPPVQMPQAALRTERDSVQTRQQVTAHLQWPASNAAEIADLSVSVFLTDSLQPTALPSIQDYMLLESDLALPALYGAAFRNDPDATDLLMLTRGWRRFTWNDVLSQQPPVFRFLPETHAHLVSGSVWPAPQDGARPLVYLSIPGEHFVFLNGTTDAQGRFLFALPPAYGSQALVLHARGPVSGYRLQVDNPFAATYSQRLPTPFLPRPSLKQAMELRVLGAQLPETFTPGSLQSFRLPERLDTSRFYGVPGKVYYTDDYTRFRTLEEVLREYVTEVRVRKRQDSFHFEVLNKPFKTYFSDNPLLLYDGVPVFNRNRLMETDPLKIKRIDVVTHAHYNGSLPMHGIVSFSSYEGDLQGYELDPDALSVDYEGLQLRREFYAPVYLTEEQRVRRLPDYRNVLHWAPDLRGSGGKTSFSFYTSDIPGRYHIVVQGVTTGGQLIRSTAFLVVKP